MSLENIDLDSEEEDSIVSPCFEIDRSVELKDVPTTGHEYLLKVITERKNYVSVTKSKIDYSKFSKNQSCFADEIPIPKSAPDALKPNLQWQNFQVANFSELRMYISKMSPKCHEKNLRIQNRKFFLEPPKLSRLIALNQSEVNRGLEMLLDTLIHIRFGKTVTKDIGQWIFSLLAYLELPLLSDTISILRDIARKCSEIRSHIKLEDESAYIAAAPLNLIICLVSKYFRQFDLADGD